MFLHPHLWGMESFLQEQVLEVQLKEGPSGRSQRASRTTMRSRPLTLTQFLRRRNKKRGGRGRDRGHSKSEAAPKRGGGGGRGAGAGGAAGLVAGHRCVDGATCDRAPSALMLPPQLPQLPVVRPPRLGGPLQGAAGMPELPRALCFAAWLRSLLTHGP